MKKMILTSIIILLIIAIAMTVGFPKQKAIPKANTVEKYENKFEFRGVKFGDGIEKIKEIESSELYSETNFGDSIIIICYTNTMFSSDVYMFYKFFKNQLYEFQVNFAISYVNRNNYIDLFYNVQNKLKNKYGKPFKDETYWSDDLYQDKPDDYGDAIAYGHLEYYSKWLQDNAIILLKLYGENFNCYQCLWYWDKKIEPKASKYLEKLEQEEY